MDADGAARRAADVDADAKYHVSCLGFRLLSRQCWNGDGSEIEADVLL